MILKPKNLFTMISDTLYNREWKLKYCFFNRQCYFSGKSLKFQLCYFGRKKIRSILSKRYENDDIWISKDQYIKMIHAGMV